MRRILLVLDDFQELSTIQGLLMKFGWDIKPVKRNLRVADEIRGFAPEAIIASASGKGINGIELSQSVKQYGFNGPFYLIVDNARVAEQVDTRAVHGIFVRPVDQRMLVRALAKYSRERQKVIVEKYEKIFGEPMLDEEQTQQAVRGKSARQEKFEQYLQSVDSVPDQPWDRSKLRDAVDQIREEEKDETNDMNRKEFVKKLFDG